MSESIDHQILVRKMRDWVATKYFEGDTSRIYVDLPELGIDRKPQAVENFIPDLLAHHSTKNIFIIGEAKTILDLERFHSIEQYRVFLKKCSNEKNAIFVLATPWEVSCAGRALLKALAREQEINNVRIIIMEQL